MTPLPKHRAAPAPSVFTSAWFRIPSVTLVVMAGASLGPSAYADKGPTFGSQPAHSWAGSQPNQGQNGQQNGPKNGPDNGQQNGPQNGPHNGPHNGPQNAAPSAQPGQPAQGEDTEHDHDEDTTLVTEPVHVETSAFLKATPQPVTAYEMPFPCGEVWTGSTRHNHSPSVRSVDFNRVGGDLGAPVVASADGVVTTAVTGKKKPSYGQHVIVNHGNDESTMYAHLDEVSVKVGQEVAAGDVLGTVGNTGNSFGSHLHYEQRQGKNVVDAWFHGSRFKMPATQASENCPQEDEDENVFDALLAGDLIGSTQAELVFYKKTSPAAFMIKRPGRSDKKLPFGQADDHPVLGDWDGDGRVNPGVRNPVTRVFSMRARGKVTTVKFGKTGDVPVAGNWDGVGAWEIGVRRPSTSQFVLRFSTGETTKVQLGDADDVPLTGDWDGDGRTDFGVYDPTTSIFTLARLDEAGLVLTTEVVFGAPGDIPVTGDWDGNGVTDLAVWTPSTGTLSQRLSASPTAARARIARAHVTAG